MPLRQDNRKMLTNSCNVDLEVDWAMKQLRPLLPTVVAVPAK